MSKFIQSNDIHEFLVHNRPLFEESLLNEAVNVRDKINEIHLIGNINLLDNAHNLVLLVVDQKEEEVNSFARKEGIVWAKYSMTLSFKLEWLRAIRKTLWEFLFHFDVLSGKTEKLSDDFYKETSHYNELIDSFINGFFISYSKYKDELIDRQQKLVNNLSAPIIPITPDVSILPLIGTIDTNRANVIEEKVLFEVGRLRIQTLIMDLSGIAEMDNEAIKLFLKLLDGVSMMGSKLVITGLRPEIVRNMIKLDVEFGTKATTKATLQKALQDYLPVDKSSKESNNHLFSR
ncbi:STAS domain-containing protein [Ornithinibacillus bavariensis]|uniref:RsbT co-antagonist protein RsbRD n=1 Tax=Ornithinibacillus bavariensis TaxID=545502 RepID=A0A920C636_9BACI|nr:STAS domain-containing protein [Ornithinibacillus bavariensis]GIO26188.1 RsbT co-antagonist protein RsbRD [Ornithinibacillus bavariensis]HAM79428.1 anti-anti-sigma factor [Ornithinibacillus sp.]